MTENADVTASAPVLAVNGLTVDFATDDTMGAAVDGISFAVRPGEIVALVGESGSGKSASAKAILGLLPATAKVSGSITVDGSELLGLSERELTSIRGAKVAMVFQEPATALNPVEKIGWQIGEALRAHRKISRAKTRAKAIELLRLVEIPGPEERVDYYPHQLSGGQKQRVVIALALANEPDLIIADEPTTALDVTVQAEILRLLRDVRDKHGRAVLLITHNMGVVADMADRVVVMRRGKIVEDGEVHEVFARPRAAYTRQLLAAVPKLDPVATGSESGATLDDVVNFQDLHVEYSGGFRRRGFHAIRGIDLRLGRGEVLGLVGESGSGKTTLGRVVVGLLRPSSGTARVLGTDLFTATDSEIRAIRRRTGVIFQDPAGSLDPLQTVGDAIAEPFRVHGTASGTELTNRVAKLLESVQLPASYARRMPDELSGGQRQRVGLARALALGPDLVIADEPTSALDVSVQADVLQLFGELREQYGFSCLFISHDLAVVDEVADRVAVLRGGEVVETGDPATVLRIPESEYTRRLVEAIPIPDPVAQRARRSLDPIR